MPGVVSSEVDSGVRVVVVPAQSSYFAGEPFSVTITFTNTRSVEAGPSRTTSFSHKRGAHSISSAPLARPPTSPGTPRASPVLPSRANSVQDTRVRKGLIGKKPASQGHLPELIEQRRKKQLAKSLSVSISPLELEEQVGEGTLATSPSFTRRPFVETRQTPTSPHVPSPLARTNGLVLSSDHPHARKQSVLDGRFSLDVLSPTTSVPPSPYSPTSSVSTFSLALDPIAESLASPYPSTPTISFPTIETPSTSIMPTPSNPNTVYAYPPPRPSRRQAQIGLGHPPNSLRGQLQNPPRTASSSSSTFPQANSELILYSYAQLSGTLSLTAVPGAPATQEQARTFSAVRSALLKRSVVGGGSMDITSSLQQQTTTPKMRQRPVHNRATSFSTGLLSLLSPSSLVASASSPAALTRWRTSGVGSARQAQSNGGFGLGLGVPIVGATADDLDDIDPETPLPTFEVQPAMLAVDLLLLPGESRSYTYTIMLPDNLPPTFRGKSLKFSYELVIGTCRSSNSGAGSAAGANSISRVMKVPIRLYNNIVVGRPPKNYDLVWPVNNRKGGALPQGTVEEEKEKGPKGMLRTASIPSPLIPSSATLYDLQQYVQRLLVSLPGPESGKEKVKSPLEENPDVPGAHENGDTAEHDALHARALEKLRRREEQEREEEGGLTGCREAVEILTRNQKKASYDVNKDGVKVAVLTFIKSAYRLGETVYGVVELNDRLSRARVLKLSAILEAHESLPSALSPSSSSRHLRRSHAEHHCSFTLNTLRTTFALDIPSDASPAFQVRVGDHVGGTPGGLEWKVRLCLLVAVAAPTSSTGTEGVYMKGMVRDGPRGEWGSAWVAPESMAPLEKPAPKTPALSSPTQQTPDTGKTTWAQFFASPFLNGEREYHDGDIEEEEDGEGGEGQLDAGYDGIKPDPAGGVGVGVDYGGGEEGWREVRLETVECEVPIKVWPGNTAFKAMDVVFDV